MFGLDITMVDITIVMVDITIVRGFINQRSHRGLHPVDSVWLVIFSAQVSSAR